ncbi:MAG: CHAT domain-containing protein, partial [Lewinella sp.]|nr:CHAT domain-containing protein [Lewinella sp.]
ALAERRWAQPVRLHATLPLLMGNEYFNSSDFGTALAYYEQARHRFQELPGDQRVYLANIDNNIAIALRELGQDEAALPQLQAALGRYQQIEDPNNWVRINAANTHHNLCWYHTNHGNWSAALHHYEAALALLQDVYPNDRYPEIGNLYLLRAKLALAQDDFTTARTFLNRALTILWPGSQDDTSPIIGPLDHVVEALDVQARLTARINGPTEALQQYRQLHELVGQRRRGFEANWSKYLLTQKVSPAYENAIALAHTQYRTTGAGRFLAEAYRFCAANKAVILLEGLQHEQAMSFSGIPPELLEIEANLQSAVTRQHTALYEAYQRDQPTDSLAAELFTAEQAYGAFIQQLENDYPDYYDLKYAPYEPPAIPTVQEALATDQILLEYFVGQDSIYTFAFTSGHQDLVARPLPGGFADSISLFRELLANGIAEDCEQRFIELSHFFYRLLVEPALAGFAPTNYERLLIIPDGLLNFIAFEALLYEPIAHLNGAEGFLLERYACAYAYSSQLVVTPPPGRPSLAEELFAGFGLEYDDQTLQYLAEYGLGKGKVDSLPPLPCGIIDTSRYLGKLSFSDEEARDIAALLHGDAWLNQEVTKKTFLDHAADYRILHLAMHGSYDLNYPLNSSLIFSRPAQGDVFLRAAEIYGMDIPADMVVLSACNTAYGRLTPGEGPMSLARAFHYAGSPSVVATLWTLADYSASRIMLLFYEELQQGLPKDQALRNAKLAYLADDQLSSPTTRYPAYWAPAVIIGSHAPLALPQRAFGHDWWWVAGLMGLIGITFWGLRSRRPG